MVTSHPNHLARPPHTPPKILSLDLNNLADDICSILISGFQVNIHFVQSQNLDQNCVASFDPCCILGRIPQIAGAQILRIAGLL